MAQIMVKPLDPGSGKKKKETAAEKTQQRKTAVAGGNLSAAGKKQIQSFVESFNARHGKNTPLALYDLDAGQKEIETLEEAIRKLEQEKFLATYGAMRGTYLAPPVSSFDAAANNAALAVLQEELSGKTRAYNLAKRYQEAVAYEDTLYRADFDQFDDYKPSDDVLYNWINDPAYRESYEASYQRIPNPNARKSRYARRGYDRMSESEIAIYNYYYAKEGKKAAQKYLDSIQETLNGRIAEDLYGRVRGNTGQELVFGVTAGFNQAGSGLANFFNVGDDYIARTPYEIASSKVREDLTDNGGKLPDWLGGASLGQVAHDLISNAAYVAPSTLVSYATGMPMAGNVLSGISAAGNAYQQTLNEGFDKGQAKGYGILVGTSEVLLEKYLGGISAYGGNKLGKAAMENLSNVDEALKMVAKTLGGGVSEFREEYLQEMLDPVFRHITLKTEEEMDPLSPDALYAGFLGALLGSGVESVDAVVKGLPVDFGDIGFATDAFQEKTPAAAFEDAEFADLLEGLEGLEGWERLKSLPEAEQEAFIESLFNEDSVDTPEENTPAAAEEIINPGEEISQADADLAVEESAKHDKIEMGAVTDNFDRKIRLTESTEDLQKTNPNYEKKEYQWRNNCQRCVPTYEMRRRGYKVTAKPILKKVSEDFLANNYTAAWENQDRIWCMQENGLQQIKKQMAAWGDGARAEISITWKNSGTGHVFVAEQRNGVTVFIDPQTGNADCSRYFENVVKGKTNILRIDNNSPSDFILDCCENGGG